MSAWQVLGLLFATVLLGFGLYIAFVFVQHQVKKRWPDTVEVRPVAVHAAPETPSISWWDELQSLRTQFIGLQSEVATNLAEAQNERRLARNAEERTRKMRSIDDEYEEAMPTPPRSALPPEAAPGGWEEEAPAPAGRQPVSAIQRILDQRRMRS